MKYSTFPLLTIFAVLTVAGCQSSPRWAWWKKDAVPADASAVARSAAPELPSVQSTPQPAASTALQAAAPPSSANLAATGTPPAAAATIPTTSAATIANAPTASYSSSASGVPPLNASALPQPGPSAASVPAAGPYDPSAYRPASALATSPAPSASEGIDRYGSGSTPASVDRYGTDGYSTAPPVPTTVAATATADRYNMPPAAAEMSGVSEMNRDPAAVTDRYGVSSTASTPGSATETAVSASLAPASNGLPPAVASATVQSSPPAGQYRPGGTSNYTGAPAEHIEVATLPAPAAPSAPGTTAPGNSSVPWSPPTSSPATPPSYRTY